MRCAAVAALLPFAGAASAAVRSADASGLTVELGPSPVKRANEIRHPLLVDRRAIERAVASGRLLLPSTDGRLLATTRATIRRRDDGLTVVTARVETTLGPQSAVLVVGDGVAFGYVPQRTGPALRIETRDGRAWLVEGDNVASPAGPDFLRVPPPTDAQRALRRRQDAAKSAASTAAGPNVDVVVLYTPTLMSVWGSQAAMEARIAYLETITNQAYVDSDVAQTVTVVGRYQVDYVNTTTNSEALEAMTSESGSPLGRLARTARAFHGADLVALLREFDRANNTSCGVGWLGGYDGAPFDPAWGFSVSADHGFGEDHCGDWTFAHELGHNMGAHHDFETTEGEHGAYSYSRGYRRTLSQTSGFATVMAYSEAPQVRVGQFSNPRLTRCLGEPCGDAVTADNARGLGQAAPSIAGFGAPPPASRPALGLSDAIVAEGDSGTKDVVLALTLSAPASVPITVQLETAFGTAVWSDFVPFSRSVVIPAGATSVDVPVSVRGDTLVERDEYFAVNVTSAPGARVVDGQAVLTIDNDEAIPSFSLADVEVVEGDTAASMEFTATLSAPSPTPVTFDVDISEYGVDGARAGFDYHATSWDDLTIPPGETSLRFAIAVIGDQVAEPDERLRIVASDLTGAEITRDWARGWILDDDAPTAVSTVSLYEPNLTVVEGDVGTRTLEFRVSVSPAAATPITFDVAATGGSATAGVDYQTPSPTITVPAGTYESIVYVPVVGDTLDESDETVELTISNVVGASLNASYSSATGTIHDDDGTLPLLIAADDRAFAVMNGDTYLHPSENDQFQSARMRDMTMTVTGVSAGGTVVVEDSGWDQPQVLRYVPALDFLGEETIGYRICESESPYRCDEADIVVVVRPGYDVRIDAEGHAGYRDETTYRVLERPEARYAGEYDATPLVAPGSTQSVLGVDPTPESAFDGLREGTSASFHVLPVQPGVPVDWRVLVDAVVPPPYVDVYVGIDDDLGQDADPGETVCRASASWWTAQPARCELTATQPGSGVLRYWVMLHNRRDTAAEASVDTFEVPLIGTDGSLTVTGPGSPDFGQYYGWYRIGWSDPTLLPSDRRAGYVAVRMGPTLAPAWIPVRIDRTGAAASATALVDGTPLTLALAAGARHDRLFVDVPLGASRLTVTTRSDRNVDLYLVHADVAAADANIVPIPIDAADASATGAGGDETIVLAGGALAPGRWYVVPVNADAVDAGLQVRADIEATAVPPRPGSYFNAARSGHGVFLYPAADQWAGLWYTYVQDGRPTWYYLQGAAPGLDGLWTGGLYRAMWDGDSQTLTAVGHATVTPTGPDEFLFTYSLDGEVGSEPMAALGRGCPAPGGSPVDASSHWFNPATAGTGHSVQFWNDYEFYAAFVYDADGVPRFLTAESPAFAGADATIPLDQLTGFCPLCARPGDPARETVGTLRRVLGNGTLSTLGVTATFSGGVSGSWNRLEPVQPLGGPGTTQGCSP